MLCGGHLHYYPLNRYDGAKGGGEESASGSTSSFCGRGRSWAPASSRSSSGVARFCYARFPLVLEEYIYGVRHPTSSNRGHRRVAFLDFGLDSCPTKVPNEDQ